MRGPLKVALDAEARFLRDSATVLGISRTSRKIWNTPDEGSGKGALTASVAQTATEAPLRAFIQQQGSGMGTPAPSGSPASSANAADALASLRQQFSDLNTRFAEVDKALAAASEGLAEQEAALAGIEA